MRHCPRPPPHPPGARSSYHNFGLARVFVKGRTTSVAILLNDLNGVECAMATPSAENVDPSGPSAALDEIKCGLSCFTIRKGHQWQ